MIPAITPVTALAGASPTSAAPAVTATSPTSATPAVTADSAATAASGTDGFANLLGTALDQLNATTSNAETLAIEGATGQANVADVTVAATEAQLAVQLATTVRNEGVTALNSIMSMQAG
ncbi:MAG: flagellar hook-basal body complex protein FliE [Acidimicrobiales bacterium]|jgi:flagellar hook-basal body complex protein FliE